MTRHGKIFSKCHIWLVAAGFCILPISLVHGASWSSTELHLQHGNLKKPFQGGGGDAETHGTTILTFKHASGWKFGDNFFFIDYLNFGKSDNDKNRGMSGSKEFYGEWYSNFSLGKITENSLSVGLIKDVGLIAGFNFAPEVDTFYYLPGLRLSLNLPGFAFANLDTMAYVQNNASTTADGVRIEAEDSFLIDFNWSYPFSIGATDWSIEGHIEYLEGVDTQVHIPTAGSIDGVRRSWVLAQPQLRMDLGKALGMEAGSLFTGIEYQYWHNKLGDGDTDESVVQLLLVWRL